MQISIRAVKEAAEFEAAGQEDVKKLLIQENEADAMVFQTEKALKDVGDKLDADDKAAVEADMQALKDVLAKSTPENTSESDVAEIKAAKEKLMAECSGSCSQRCMSRQVRAQQAVRLREQARTGWQMQVRLRMVSREMTW